MKTLKLTAIALMASLMSVGAQAKVWSTVEVTLAGTTDTGGVYLKLNDTAASPVFTDRVFRMLPKLDSAGLAIGLAGVSSKRKLVIQSDVDEIDAETFPTILSIYLSKDTVPAN